MSTKLVSLKDVPEKTLDAYKLIHENLYDSNWKDAPAIRWLLGGFSFMSGMLIWSGLL